MKTIRVQTAEPYDILIHPGLLKAAGAETAARVQPGRAMLVCDSTVAPLYADLVAASYQAAGFSISRFVFPAGEESKTMQTLQALLAALAEAEFCRSDLLLALGGGVTGDLTGFAAAIYLRGLCYVQLPTTVLAAVDSSVGGKTAVDLPQGKNLVGCFYQPVLVLCDTDTFATLPESTFADGMAEVVKYGVILDQALFLRLEAGSGKAEIEDIVATCCQLKQQVVEADPFDHGIRTLLNFGHTIGHAIEKVSAYAVPHGRAVAVGMVAMAAAAAQHGLGAPDLAERIARLNAALGLPVSTRYPLAALQAAVRADKKRLDKGITIVVPSKLGAAECHTLAFSELDEWLGEGLAAAAKLQQQLGATSC